MRSREVLMNSWRYAADMPFLLPKTQLPPTQSEASKQVKGTPRSWSAFAAAIPEEPAPMTATVGRVGIAPASQKVTHASSSYRGRSDAVQRVHDPDDVALLVEVHRQQVWHPVAEALAHAGAGQQRRVRVDPGRVAGSRCGIGAHPVVDEEQRRARRAAVRPAARRPVGLRGQQRGPGEG